jgi:hypothetical protein
VSWAGERCDSRTKPVISCAVRSGWSSVWRVEMPRSTFIASRRRGGAADRPRRRRRHGTPRIGETLDRLLTALTSPSRS